MFVNKQDLRLKNLPPWVIMSKKSGSANGMECTKTDPQLKAFVDKLDIVPPLNPREAFFGGRTNAIKLHHKVDENENEKIEYRDIISLYPCANLECEYPICHPEFIDQPRTTDISRY